MQLDPRDRRPIYEQLKDHYRRLITAGVLKADDKMPSVRELSASLAINPNTIQRAYRELEAEGFIYSLPARGSFVRGDADALQRRREELFTRLDALAAELQQCGVTPEEIAAHLTKGA